MFRAKKQSGKEGKMRKGGYRSTLYRSLSHFGARDWIRTSTSLRTLRPEHSASTNFATRAVMDLYSGVAKVMLFSELQRSFKAVLEKSGHTG